MRNLRKDNSHLWLAVLSVCFGVLALFFALRFQESMVEITDSEMSQSVFEKAYTLTETDRSTDEENAASILLEKEAEIYKIEEAGTYVVTGDGAGQIQIDVEDQIVHLILKDVNLQSYNGPAVYVKSAAKVIVTIPEGSNCILMDSAYYADYTEAEACIYSTADLTINGSGTLQVYGYCKDAIRTKEVLKVLDVMLAVSAKNTGLRGNDGVVILSEKLKIQCEGIGIYTKKEQTANRGFVDLGNGRIEIIAGEYGIRASENLYIHDCSVSTKGVLEDIVCLGRQYTEEGCLE